MATTTFAVPDDKRWPELARVLKNLPGQLRVLADAGCRESERMAGLETTRQIQEEAAGLAQWQGTGAAHGGKRQESKSLVGKNLVSEGLANRRNSK